MNENYLTVSEFAERAGVSKRSIYKQLHTRLKPYTQNIDGVKLVSVQALVDFYGSEPSEPCSEPCSEPSEPCSEPCSEPSEPCSEPNIIEILREEIRFLREQVTAKDKQISDLSEALKAEQQLHAVDKKMLLEQKQEKSEVPEVPEADITVMQSSNEKKGFFAKLFGRQ